MNTGVNLPILSEQIVTLLGEERVSRFSNQLGISKESTQKALAEALLGVVDQATGESESIVDDSSSK